MTVLDPIPDEYPNPDCPFAVAKESRKAKHTKYLPMNGQTDLVRNAGLNIA